jgi:hypothetical protein
VPIAGSLAKLETLWSRWARIDTIQASLYYKKMRFNVRRLARQMSLCAVVLAIAWFALGTALNTMVAFASGKTIDIVVCSGAGVKKLSAPAQGSEGTSSTIKHCGNAPIYKLLTLPGNPVHLNFEAPHTVAVWQWIASPPTLLDLIQANKPPPGRAPPVHPTA